MLDRGPVERRTARQRNACGSTKAKTQWVMQRALAVAQQRAAQAEERLAELKALVDDLRVTATLGGSKPKPACYRRQGRRCRVGGGYARLGEKAER